MAVEGKTIDALSQFELAPVLGPIGNAVAFTQSNVFMLVALGLTCFLVMASASRGALVPGRFQAMGEAAYEFVANPVAFNGKSGR